MEKEPKRISRVCEICGKEEYGLINIGLDVGFHIGDYGSGEYEKHKIEPVCVEVCAIYLCNSCLNKIEKNKFFKVNVMPQLKGLIKKDWVKNMILEGLK